MDFDVPQDRGIHFFYVLPYSPCEALVEATFFSSTPLVAAEYDAAIDRYLHVRFGVDDYEVIGREQGRLPMFDARARPQASGIVPIGITGGACRRARATRSSQSSDTLDCSRAGSPRVVTSGDGPR